jgi:hypothetical protein
MRLVLVLCAKSRKHGAWPENDDRQRETETHRHDLYCY